MSAPLSVAQVNARVQQAVQALGQGEPAQARAIVEPLVVALPQIVELRLLLARVLQAMDDAVGAEAALRPMESNPRAATALSRLLCAAGRAAEALVAVALFADGPSPSLEILTAKAAAEKALGRPEDALATYVRAHAAAPQSGLADHNLAAAFGDLGRHAQARDAAERALAKGLKAPETWLVLARARLGLRELDAAEAALGEALRLRPGYGDAARELAELAWMRRADAGEALAVLDAALAAAPGTQELITAKARVLHHAGREGERRSLLADAASRPELVGLLPAASRAALADGDAAAALALARQAMAGGETPEGLAVLCEACLGAGLAAEAVDAATGLLALRPRDRHAIALRATAWRMLGDRRYRDLYDYAAKVVEVVIACPPAWPDLAAYLTDLALALETRHGFKAPPLAHSVRAGSQTLGDLRDEDDPAIRAFFEAIDAPIRAYLALQAREDGHPLPDAYGLSGAWSVRLTAGGFHADHVHAEGAVSATFYVATPPGVGDEGREGWLRFGAPGMRTSPDLPAEHFVRPAPGLLVLFPSYMWHGTVPFDGPAARLTIAFDVAPAA